MRHTLILLVLMTFTFSAWSQPVRGQRPSPPSIEERIEKAKEELDLSDDQAAAWKTIFDKYDDQIQEARQNQDRKAGESIRKNMNDELLATLTEEQQEAFKKWQDNRPQRNRRGG